jgi:hypothetical protein
MRLFRASCAVLIAAGALGIASPAQASPSRKKAMWGPITVKGKSAFPIYRHLGVGIFQTTLSWDAVAATRPAWPRDPADPSYRWPRELDLAISEGRRYGIRTAVQLAGFPAWANGNRPHQWVARNPRDFADFAAAASRRYPGVRYWQILGEPSRVENFMPLTPGRKRGPRLYARLLDTAYGALKHVDRRDLVIGGNTFTVGQYFPYDFIRAMKLPNGKAPRMDLYGHNPFTARRPDLRQRPIGTGLTSDFSDLDTLARVLDRELRRPKIPIFISELTWPTDHPNHEFNFHVTRRTQARWLSDALRISRRWRRIYTLGWISLYDEMPLPAGGQSNRGLLDWRGRKKPAFYAYARG